MDTIVLRNITVAPQDASGQPDMEDVQFSAHLIIEEDVVHETTGVAKKQEAGKIWKWSDVFLVPVVYPCFHLGIIRIDSNGVGTHQGAVEIIMERIEPHASKQETHFVVQTSSQEDKDFMEVSFTAYSSTSNFAKGPSPPPVLTVAKAMGCEALIALLTQIVVSDTAFMNPDLGLISTIHGALIRLPSDGLHKPRALGLLANLHLARYDRFSEMMGENAQRYPMFIIYSKGVDKAISLLEVALSLSSDDHPKRSWMVLTLAMCLQRKLILQSTSEDSTRITALRMSEILTQMSDDEPKKPIFSNYLGEVFRRCFETSKKIPDLDLSIALHEEAARLIAADSPYKIAFLVELIASLHERLEFGPQPEDADRLVVLQEQLLLLSPSDFPGRLLILRNLGQSFFIRYEERGDTEALEKSTKMYQEALTLTPDDHPQRPSILNNLAASLSMTHGDPNYLQNLRQAIKLIQQAIRFTSDYDPLRLQFIKNLGNSILSLFETETWDIDLFKIYNQFVFDAITFCNEDGQGILISNFEKFTINVDFQGLTDSAIVEVLIPLYRSTINACPDHKQIKTSLLYKLGSSLSTAFEDGRDRLLLDHSIVLLKDAIRLCPEDSPKTAVTKSALGSVYLLRYLHFHDEDDWDNVDMSSTASLESLQYDLSDRHVILRQLGCLNFQQFCRTTDVQFLDRTIEVYQDIFRDFVQDSSWPEISRSLIEGSTAFFRRFQVLSLHTDLDEAILLQQRAIDGSHSNSRKKAKAMFDLSKLFFWRFHHFHNMDDMDQAFFLLQDSAILTVAPDRPDVKPSLQEYYDVMSKCFQSFSGSADVDICVQDLKLIACGPDTSQPTTDLRIHNIGMFLSIRLPQSDTMDTISRKTFDSLEDSIRLFADTRIDKGLWLSMLGDISLRIFEKSHRKDDLDKAVLLGEEAIGFHPDGTSSFRKGRQFLFILNLATSLRQRFDTFGDLADLIRLINILEDASIICPKEDASKYQLLDALGNSFVLRYDILGDIFDLNKAAHAMQEAMDLSPDVNPKHHILQQNIGRLFQRRLKISGNRQDAQIAVDTLKSSMDTLPGGSVELLEAKVACSKALLARFWHFRAGEDLDEATEILEGVLPQLPSDSRQKPGVLHDLGSALAQRFVQRGEIDDINRCILFLEQSKDIMREDDPGRYMLLFDLGRWLPTRYERLHNKQDLKHANDALRTASSLSSAPYMWRFRAASLRSYWTQAFIAKGGSDEVDIEGYKDALALLPKIAWLGMPLQSRQWHLVEVGDVVLDAVAAAIQCSRYDVALEWLEAGRSVTWGQLLDLRTPVDILQDSHPTLAKRFSELSNALGEMEFKQATTSDATTIPPSRRYHELADEREKLLQRIRALDGFQNFLSPKLISDLLAADFKGPVITLNINKFRSDALVLMPNKQILHIPLPNFSPSEAYAMMKDLKALLKNRNALRGCEERVRATKRSPFARRGNSNAEADFRGILSKLWIHVARPILDGMGLMSPPKDPKTELPRIWWCLTGPMILLPIHAAGLYGSDCPPGSKSKLTDFAVSSYIPSLSALMRCSHPRQVHKKKLLAIALPVESALPCTQTEMNLLQTHGGVFPVECLVESAATYENVVRGLENAGWVHFACHGIQDNQDPTQSALLLSGGQKLTLSDISKLSLPHAELAFLSACQTATGDELLPEEAVHLAAGMLLAGYQGVIGTLWSIPDIEGPKIADEFYSQILSGGNLVPDPERAAYALHASTQAVQKNSEVQPSFFSWVPFVHYGL